LRGLLLSEGRGREGGKGKGRKGKGRELKRKEVEVGIWPTEKFWRDAPMPDP